MKATRQSLFREIIGRNGKIFNVKFIKADGSLRSMNCRFGVKPKTPSKTGKRYNPESHDLVCVFDMDARGYRTFNYDRLISVKSNGVTYDFTENTEDYD